jgi:hypothetical protein
MADGREYRVPRRDFITVPPKASFVIVVDEEGKSEGGSSAIGTRSTLKSCNCSTREATSKR